MMNSAVLILAVCRAPVTYELSKMTLLSMSSRSSVDKAPARCLGGHGFDSCRGLRFFFVPRSCCVEYFIFQIDKLYFRIITTFIDVLRQETDRYPASRVSFDLPRRLCSQGTDRRIEQILKAVRFDTIRVL